mgnify:CR=1 FL=1
MIESGKLGNLLEVEMHYDYYRPEIPLNVHEYVGTMDIYMVMDVIL